MICLDENATDSNTAVRELMKMDFAEKGVIFNLWHDKLLLE
jgi:hypothetical protein